MPQADYTTTEIAKLFRVLQSTPREAHSRYGHWMGIKPIKLPNHRLLWPKAKVDALLRAELDHTVKN
ncbi:DNA-binding protein [Alcaligenaceae bacterium]|nr:DNA-binding protein [Alcaligenaceae bacterium]